MPPAPIKAVACRLKQEMSGALAVISIEPTGSPPTDTFKKNGFFMVVEGRAPAEYFYEGPNGPIWADEADALLYRIESYHKYNNSH